MCGTSPVTGLELDEALLWCAAPVQLGQGGFDNINPARDFISKNGIFGIFGILLRKLDRDFLSKNGIFGINGITVCFAYFIRN